jgi:hypothetical protein
LWGAIERAEEQLSSPLWDQARERYAGPLLTAEGAVFEGARAAGRSLTLEDAVELASATR